MNDFTEFICPTLGGWLPEKVTPPTLGVTNSHGVTGGVYKGPGTYSPRHADPAVTSDSDFVQASWSLQSELRTV